MQSRQGRTRLWRGLARASTAGWLLMAAAAPPASAGEGGARTRVVPLDRLAACAASADSLSFDCGSLHVAARDDNRFVLSRGGQRVATLDLSDSGYDGPDYSLFLYRSHPAGPREVLLIEATADPGTAWYYAAVLERGRLRDGFRIGEPRADSEATALGDFLAVSTSEDTVVLRFAKARIAPYSRVPEGLREHDGGLYLQRRLPPLR